MLDPKFSYAQVLFNFYMKKLDENGSNEAQNAIQYANLQVMRYRLTCVLDTLHSYQIEVS